MAGIVVIMVFGILGIIFSSGKGAFLIAGFNTLPPEEQDNYDTVAMCKFMGKMMFLFVFSMVLWLMGDLLAIAWLFIIGITLFFGIVVFMLIYLNTNDRFKKDEEGRKER